LFGAYPSGTEAAQISIMTPLGRVARAVEFAVAIFLSLAVVALHFNVMQHAGPLWRDEISSLRVATMPTFDGFWSALVYDPVPALFFGLLRLWNSFAFGATDEGLRYLGFLIGLGILIAIWTTSWMIKKSPPIWALLLLGLSPVALVWGDSMRAYGLGCLCNILAIGFLWKVVSERPRPAHVALALATALLSVHSLFPNALLLFAAGMAGMTVAASRHWWRSAAMIFAIGTVAALSLLPYASVIRQTQSWSPLAKTGVDINWILTMMFRATQSGGNIAACLWIGGAVVVCLAFLAAACRPAFLRLPDDDKNLFLYAGITLFVALGATVCFFRFVGWATSLWYYLPVMATAVVCIDTVAKVFRRNPVLIMANCAFVLAAAGLMSPLSLQATNVRLTNIDLATEKIAQHAEASDLVVVDNYFYAISFNRYYHGRAPWLTMPNAADVSLHRWDLLTDTMRQPDPIRPLLNRIDQTLRSGHKVFVLGFAPLGRAAAEPASLPAAPAEHFGWSLWPYVRHWTVQIAYAVQTHAEHGMIVDVPCTQPVSVVENVRTVVVSGWKDPQVAAIR
jgi:hypothetical protein